jgi:transcriptional regulator with XRE-family HTH domain
MIRKIGRFKYIASVIRAARLKFPNLTQETLSEIIGYQNAQFISNVERGLCTVPAKRISKLCEVLKIEPHEVVNAIVRDYESHIRSKL